jgi:hypothetical protein
MKKLALAVLLVVLGVTEVVVFMWATKPNITHRREDLADMLEARGDIRGATQLRDSIPWYENDPRVKVVLLLIVVGNGVIMGLVWRELRRENRVLRDNQS